jgi:hypothetical protein
LNIFQILEIGTLALPFTPPPDPDQIWELQTPRRLVTLDQMGFFGLMLGSPSGNLHIGIIFYGIQTAFLKLEKTEI